LIWLLSDVNAVTVRGFGNNVRYLLVFFLVLCLRLDDREQRWTINLMMGMLGTIAISGVVLWLVMSPTEFLYMLGNEPWELADAYGGGFPRALSILVSANSLGRTMGVLLLGLLIWYSSKASLPVRVGQISVMIIAIISLLLSLSRSSWLGMSLAMATVAFLNRRVRLAVALLGVTIVFFLAPLLTLSLQFSNVEEIPIVHRALDVFDSKDGSTALRFRTFPKHIDLIVSNPLGIGLGRSSLSRARLERAGGAGSSDVYYSESLYLQLGIETGYIGLGLFIAMAILVPRTLWRKTRTVSGFEKKVCLWALASAVLLFSASTVFPALSSGLVAPAYAWTLVGLAVSYRSDLLKDGST
jgi:O-antigen ligase